MTPPSPGSPATSTYDAYGATTSSTGSQPNPCQFAGQQTDPTRLQYLRARYYDPVTGTFLSSDPLGVSPAWPGNPYAYANGNPATLVDPYGLWGIPSFVKKAAEAVDNFVESQASKHLPGADALTNLSDLQTIIGVVAFGACRSGVVEVCVVGGIGYFGITLAKTVELRASEQHHTMSSSEGECRYLTEAPLPFPFNIVGSAICGVIGAITSPGSSALPHLGEKQQFWQ